jgi:uncharacterized protein (TIGR00297 family)
VLASVIALGAHRAGSLARSGAAVAIVVGTIAIATGWSWGALLIAFFIASSALSRFHADAKARRTGDLVAKGGARDAAQVLANGGGFACAALFSLLVPWDGWMALGLGALAATTADTWGTEVGTLSDTPPRSITTGRTVPAGTSGAVTRSGLAATAAGALFVAGAAALFGWPPRVAGAALAGGIVGALADSLLGALWQERRWCPRCAALTERDVHTCGATTELAGGMAWMNNDVVNFLSSLVGAAAALLVAHGAG